MLDPLSPTERSAKLIADRANGINPQIQVTMNTPKRDIEGLFLPQDKPSE